jgi:hypothetical protein
MCQGGFVVLKTILVSLITLEGTSASNGQTQQNWKDRAEYDLYSEIIKAEASSAERLQNLDKWKAGYPQSEYSDTRLKIYLVTYQQMKNHRGAFDTAVEILKSERNDLGALAEIVNHGLQLLPEQPNASFSEGNRSDLDAIRKASRYILENLDLIYGTDKKPLRMSADNWRSIKTKMKDTAQTVMNRAAELGQR